MGKKNNPFNTFYMEVLNDFKTFLLCFSFLCRLWKYQYQSVKNILYNSFVD